MEITRGDGRQDADLAELEALLDRRLEIAAEGVSTRSIEEIFSQAREEAPRASDDQAEGSQ